MNQSTDIRLLRHEKMQANNFKEEDIALRKASAVESEPVN